MRNLTINKYKKRIKVYYPFWGQTDLEKNTNCLFYKTEVNWRQEKPDEVNGKDMGGKLIENEIIVTSDCQLTTLCIILKGIKEDEPHKVFSFLKESEQENNSAYRAGSTDLEFNMNAHIRKSSQIFLIQTERNGPVTAKLLDFENLQDKQTKRA